MAIYTMQFRKMINRALQSQGLDLTPANWNKIYSNIGLADYPIFDEQYREILNNKIIIHYYQREIAGETEGQEQFYLWRTMNEIMPYYNELYKSTMLEFDPLTNYSRKGNNVNASKADSNMKAQSKGEDYNSMRNLYSDTPMSHLNIENVERGDYLTNATFDKSNTSTNTNNDSASKSNHSSSGSYEDIGYFSSPSDLLMRFRKSIINVDLQIVEDKSLQQCFFNIY